MRIEVVDLWAGIRKEPYVRELNLTYRRSSVLASGEHGRYLEACDVRDSHDRTLGLDILDSNDLGITLSRVQNNSREIGDVSGHRAGAHVGGEFKL